MLYVGSSPLLRGVSPMVMWQEHGFTGYVRASALQAPSVSYGLLAESLKYQNPKLVVLSVIISFRITIMRSGKGIYAVDWTA